MNLEKQQNGNESLDYGRCNTNLCSSCLKFVTSQQCWSYLSRNFQFKNGTNKIYTIIFCGNAQVYGYSYLNSICNSTSPYYCQYEVQTPDSKGNTCQCAYKDAQRGGQDFYQTTIRSKKRRLRPTRTTMTSRTIKIFWIANDGSRQTTITTKQALFLAI